MCRQAVEWIARNEYRGRDAAAAVDPISIVRSTYLYYPSLIIIIVVV